jgi:hypothetical protein
MGPERLRVAGLSRKGPSSARLSWLQSGSTETRGDIAQRHTEHFNGRSFSKTLQLTFLCVSLCDVSVCLCATALQ